MFMPRKEFQRSDCDDIGGKMVESGPFETEEADCFAWNLGNSEVPSHVSSLHVVVVSTINFAPRGPII